MHSAELAPATHCGTMSIPAGMAWLLQFIENMQQSRQFNKICKLGQLGELPEVHSLPTQPPKALRADSPQRARGMYPERAQASGPIQQVGQLEPHTNAEEEAETAGAADHGRNSAFWHEKTDEDILELNVIVVYKKLVHGLIYSPLECSKYFALDAEPPGSEVLGPMMQCRIK